MCSVFATESVDKDKERDSLNRQCIPKGGLNQPDSSLGLGHLV